jgi:hypothetical protein
MYVVELYDGGWVNRGIRVSFTAPWVSHLFLSDDCVGFMRADVRRAMRLNESLASYSLGYGQSANK